MTQQNTDSEMAEIKKAVIYSCGINRSIVDTSKTDEYKKLQKYVNSYQVKLMKSVERRLKFKLFIYRVELLFKGIFKWLK